MIEGVNIGHALIAGFLAGFVFTLSAYWLEGVYGFPRMDFGAMGLKYMGGDKPGWWFVGQAYHHLVSMILALVYAGAVFLNLEDIFDKPIEWWWGPIAGAAYGLVVLLVVPTGLLGTITVLLGGKLPSDRKMMVANLILHLVWGATLGALYFPVR
jgi:hypothetical protein